MSEENKQRLKECPKNYREAKKSKRQILVLLTYYKNEANLDF